MFGAPSQAPCPVAWGVPFGPWRDLIEDGGSAKQKGGLGIYEACSRWQVHRGGRSTLAVGDCARGGEEAGATMSLPRLVFVLFIYGGGWSHPSVLSRASATMGPGILATV